MFKELFYLQKNDRRALIVFLAIGVAVLSAVALSGVGDTTNDAPAADTLSATARRTTYGYGAGRYHDRYGATRPTAADALPTYAVPVATPERFAFDPNTADSTQLLRLGLSPWQVRGIYRYRAKGGVYRQPTDFARVYGLTLKQYRELEPYIHISPDYRPAAATVATSAAHVASAQGAARRDTVRYPVKLRPTQHISLNRSDTSMLKRVPGIGSYYARRIVDYRERLGGYHSVDQLLEIEGMPEEALAYIKIDAVALRRININRLTLAQLRRHPYISHFQARAIVDYRRLKGPLTSLQQLSTLPDFTAEDIERLRPYVEF